MHSEASLIAHYKAVKARLNLPRVLTKQQAPTVAVKPIDPVKSSDAPDEPIILRTRANQIVYEVSRKYKITKKDMISHQKLAYMVQARFECAYRLKTELGLPLATIGKFMNRDHTSILYACRKYKENLKRNGEKNNDHHS